MVKMVIVRRVMEQENTLNTLVSEFSPILVETFPILDFIMLLWDTFLLLFTTSHLLLLLHHSSASIIYRQLFALVPSYNIVLLSCLLYTILCIYFAVYLLYFFALASNGYVSALCIPGYCATVALWFWRNDISIMSIISLML